MKIIIIMSLMLVACNQPASYTTSSSAADSLTLASDTTLGDSTKVMGAVAEGSTDDMHKNEVKIIKFYTTDPNSAGGVSCDIIWKNISSKTIKYIHFLVAPYNAVDDKVTCSIRGYSSARIQSTGPFKPGKTYGYGNEWDNVWYNYSIKRMKIESVEVEYMN
jgi:hypothetical protein